MPAKDADGGNVTTIPLEDNPQPFEKRSTPPALLAPAAGSDPMGPPGFRWSAVEGARNYRLQVATDEGFTDLVDDLTTASTSYTSPAAYPAETALYWRVRANDETGTGLEWSASSAFRRRLAAPAPSPGNPAGGTSVPLLTWSPVDGATSYDFHIQQADGRERDFRVGSTAGTFRYLYGAGVMRWSVRANFPVGVNREMHGPWSPVQSFVKRIDAPTGALQAGGHHFVILTWNPSLDVKQYRVQVSDSDSFTRLIEDTTTDNTSFAPDLRKSGYEAGGDLYWRVAALDEGQNQSDWTTRLLTTPRAMKVRVRGSVRKRRSGVVRVTVTDANNRPLRHVRVRAFGAGVRVKPKRTGKHGAVRFAVKPRRKGRLVVRAGKSGFRPGRVAIPVR
jgi:hypothetical protein